jgi:predicted nucleotidyltransferase
MRDELEKLHELYWSVDGARSAGLAGDSLVRWVGGSAMVPEMAALAQELQRGLAEAASAVPGLRVAFLFGSQRSGRTWAESDLDLLVRFERALDSEARGRAELLLIDNLTRVLGALGERADIADLDRADSAVAFRAIRDGVCVWCCDEQERIRAIVDVARRYDDETPMRELFQQAAKRAVARMHGGSP